MSVDAAVTSHYSSGSLLERILAGLAATGVDLAALRPEDLVPAEHFHTGGAEASARFLRAMEIAANARVLDIGCGIGGVSRMIVQSAGAHATGIDLTPEFTDAAIELSARVGLAALTEFRTGSATDLPVEDSAFDAAVMVHVGMNIADKAAIFGEAARALKPGARFGVYDVMRMAEGDLAFPVPWSTGPETSFLATPEAYRAAAEAAGFALVSEADFGAEAVAARPGPLEPPEFGPLGPHLMMGPTAPQKVMNYQSNLRAGRVAPVEMIFRKEG